MFPIHDDTERLHGRPYLNYTLIAVNAAIFVWEAAVTGFFTDERAAEELFLTYGTVPDRLSADPQAGAFTIVTSMFMHGGPAHIVGNMVFLWIFGDNIEDKFGRVKYILIYLAWGGVAALTHSAYALSTGDGAVPAVGASGAISGILGAYVVLFHRAKIYTVVFFLFIRAVRIPVLVYIPLWFAQQVIFTVIGITDGVAYLAHIGGFAAGVATGLVARVVLMPRLAGLAGTGTTYTPSRKIRPRIEDVVGESPPEVIEGPDYYEIIAEIRGVASASEIGVSYEPESKTVRITARGARRYEVIARLPDATATPTVKYVQYLNGIARIRLSK